MCGCVFGVGQAGSAAEEAIIEAVVIKAFLIVLIGVINKLGFGRQAHTNVLKDV